MHGTITRLCYSSMIYKGSLINNVEFLDNIKLIIILQTFTKSIIQFTVFGNGDVNTAKGNVS